MKDIRKRLKRSFESAIEDVDVEFQLTRLGMFVLGILIGMGAVAHALPVSIPECNFCCHLQ
jgi:hypothetical protein